MNFYDQDSTIIGVDEVGRGCLAGDVYACAFLLDKASMHDYNNNLKKDYTPLIIKDSKKINHQKRKIFYNYVKCSSAHLYAIGIANVEEINDINILHASLLAMKRAIFLLFDSLESLKEKPENNSREKTILQNCADRHYTILIDGNKLPSMPKSYKNFTYDLKCIIKGDEKYAEISSASIMAKIYRDSYMCNLSLNYPFYDWHNNKGYGSINHFAALQKFGPTPLHRKIFIRNIIFS